MSYLRKINVNRGFLIRAMFNYDEEIGVENAMRES